MNTRIDNNQDSCFRNGMTDGSLHDKEAKGNNYLSVEKQIDEIIDAIVKSPIEKAIKAVMAAIDDEADDDYLDDICFFRTFLSEVVACDKNLLNEFYDNRFDHQMSSVFRLIALPVVTHSVQTMEELEECEYSIAMLMSCLKTNPFHDYCAHWVKATFALLEDKTGFTPQHIKFE